MTDPSLAKDDARQLPRLDRMHSIGIGVLIVLVVASQLLLQFGLTRSLNDAPNINVAGRQRMLSQRISKVALQALLAENEALRVQLRPELLQATADWREATKLLNTRAAAIGADSVVKQKLATDLDTVHFTQNTMLEAAEQLLEAMARRSDDETAIKDHVRVIIDNEPQFLSGMEAVVKDFEYSARDHVENLRTLSLWLCIAMLLMLAYQGALVFRPAFRVIRRQFAALNGELQRRTDIEKALRASEQWSTALISQMQNGIVVFDEDGRITAANRASEKMFGTRASALIGKTPHDLFIDAVSNGNPASFREHVGAVVSRVSERVGRRADGSTFPCEIWVYEAQMPSGHSYVADMRDVSEGREVERMKKEFVSTVSHELRTPLTSIRGSLSLLSGGVLGDLPDDVKDVVDIAERNVVRLITLINDILDLEKLDAGKLDMEFAPVAVGTLLTRATEAVRGFADQEGIALDIAPTSALANADADRIVQVLVNLLSNAIKFSPRGSTVRAEATTTADEAEIRIIDQGRGIPADAVQLIFERFRQVDSSDSRRKGGTGLGLAICKAIVEQHMGSITVESQVGKGSTFIVRLPRAVQPTALVCEGDSQLRTRFVAALEARNYQVVVARAAQDADRILRSEPPDVAVLDLGFEAEQSSALLEAAHYAQSAHGTPILFVGDHVLLSPEQHSRELAKFIATPLETERLLQVVRASGSSDVLLVDDDEAFATVMARQLADHGIDTRIATNGRQAAELLSERLPSLLVLDVGLPDTDGFDIVADLRQSEASRRLPLLVFSGRDFDNSDRRRLSLGPTRFLTKSRASEAEFCAVVEDLLGRPRTEH